MAYTDYKFYTKKYFGKIIPENEFREYAERASDCIDNYTMDRLVDGFPENERAETKVQKAVCAVADEMYKIEQAKKASMDAIGTIQREDGTVVNKTVSSVSSGNESISYANGNSQSNRYTVAATNVQEEKRILLEAAVSYLFNVTDDNGVYLLYRGI